MLLDEVRFVLQVASPSGEVARTSCKRKAKDNYTTVPGKIIRVDEKVAASPDLTKHDVLLIKRSMYYERRKNMPPLPRSAVECLVFTRQVDILTGQGENLLAFSGVELNTPMLILAPPSNLVHLCQAKTILGDGTFKYCPPHFLQIYTLHGFLNNGHYVPLVFALLPDKRQDTYALFLQKLVELCKAQGLVFAPNTILVDFEMAAHNAIRRVLPITNIGCCRFHFAQSIFRKIGELGLRPVYRDRAADESRWLHHFFGLPLLPNDMVEATFTDHFMAEAPGEDIYQTFSDYILHTYIEPGALFPPAMWAWPPGDNPHTTNACESFHARLSGVFENPHPNIYAFLQGFKQLQTVTYIALRSLNTPAIVSATELARRAFAGNTLNRLLCGEIGVYQYVSIVAYKYLPNEDM